MGRRGGIVGLRLALLLCLGAVARCWWVEVEGSARVVPSYPREEIAQILEKGAAKKTRTGEKRTGENGRDLEPADYERLYRQTGMSPVGVEALFAEGRQEELLTLQENLFAEITVDCMPNTIITREERASKRALIPYIEEGDILVTFNCHAYAWRNGHVALVVDAGKRLTLEASQLGTESSVGTMKHWEEYPAFAVLRLKDADKEERAAISVYACENLVDIPYRLEAAKNNLSGTHCAHLTWYACRQFGFDIDSDGGMIVTPRDIFDSDRLQIVQIYGMPMPDFDAVY